MKEELNKIWEQARDKYMSVHIDFEDSKSVIYKGIKIIKTHDDIRIYSTETDFYEDITDSFVKDSFDIGLKQYLSDKYLRNLNYVENMIKNEINNNKNHKRFSYLKSMRVNILNRYNEINS